MADNTLNAVRAARRAMERVVGPAVATDDPVAREQAQLVAATLRMLEDQLPFTRERQVYELRRNIELAREVRAFATDDLGDELDAALAVAEGLVASIGPADRELVAATAALTATCAALVRSSDALAPEVRQDLVGRVVDRAGDVIEGQRSWFAGQGWGGTGTVRPMTELFAAPAPGGDPQR